MKLSLQRLINQAADQPGKEQDLSKDLRIEISVHGKPMHLWKLVLHLTRVVRLACGDRVVFMTLGGDELVDELTDDDGECWHALDWRRNAAVDNR